MNSDRQIKLINRIDRAKDLLKQNIDPQLDDDSIATLESIGDCLQHRKLVVKIVSPSPSLAAGLVTKHRANENLRSLYEFQAVAPISQIHDILQHCDLICLIYEKKHSIREHHYKLIELAQKQNIDLLILVQKSKFDPEPEIYSNWQQDLATLSDRLLTLPFDYFIDLDCPEQFDLHQRSLIDLATVLDNNRTLRMENAIVEATKSFFARKITNLWQSIQQVNAEYFAGEPLHLYQQQFRQNTQTLNQFRQQLVRDIKQAIEREKTGLLNPFTVESLIFNFQQLINSSQTKIVTQAKQTYLCLVLADFPQQPLLHEYVLDLCQQRVDYILENLWSKTNYVYGDGGLNALVELSNRELNQIEKLIDSESEIILHVNTKHPSLKIEQFIDPYCFRINTRIPFDYNFAQSSWFRLFISALVGTAIYLSTWLYLGTGKYIGFMIIIFQIINLLTGQNIKKAKLKQHHKELKRIVDRECQSLVRTVINHLTQTLIVAVERECQYQQEYTQAIAIAQNKLDRLKQVNESHKSSIEILKRDRDKIIAWFE